jgi:autotransporter-associated beta strand protein
MKPTARLRLFLSGAITIVVCSFNTHAQTITKADNTSLLNNAASYVSGGPPNVGGTNTILIDGTFTATRTAALGANIAVAGINQDSTADFQFQISNTAGLALTIGSGGVTKASTINGAGLIFANAVTLGANQTWTIAGGGTGNNLQMNGAFSDGGNTLAVTGTGTFDLRGTNTFGSNVTIDTTVSVNGAAATVTLGGANTMNTLNIPSGRVIGATLNNFGVASNFGDGGTNTAIALGNTTNGVMEYSGITATSNRTVNRDARSAASGIDVTTPGQTLTLTSNLGSGSQTNAGTNGWTFGGAGNLTLNGVISNATGGGSTGTSITKNNGGTLTLGSTTNSYTGATDVLGGKLVVNGNISTSSLTTVAVDATLGGVGTVGKTIVNGTLAVGNSPGVMTFTNTLGLNGSTIMEIDGIAGVGVVGGHDFANLTGSGAAGVLTYGGAMTLDMGVIFGIGSRSWNLFDMASETGTFTTIALTDKYSGSLLDGDLNGVWDLTSGDNTWQFTESTGVLGLTVVPEPRAALLGGLGILALLRRRRAR